MAWLMAAWSKCITWRWSFANGSIAICRSRRMDGSRCRMRRDLASTGPRRNSRNREDIARARRLIVRRGGPQRARDLAAAAMAARRPHHFHPGTKYKMKRSVDRILHNSCRQLDPAAAAAGVPARQAGGQTIRPGAAYDRCLTQSVARHRPAAGRGRHRCDQRWRVRKIDQLVAIRVRTPERVRAASGEARRQSVSARRRSRTLRGVLCRARCSCQEIATRTDSVCVGPISYTGQVELQRDIDNFKGAGERSERPARRL